MARRMLTSPIWRYSSRVLKTAPSQCVWGTIQNTPVLAAVGPEFWASAAERPPEGIVAPIATSRKRDFSFTGGSPFLQAFTITRALCLARNMAEGRFGMS